MIPTVGTALGLTVDTRWTHGVFGYRDGDESGEFEVPFLGWAPIVNWVAGPTGNTSGDASNYEANLQPVFMDEHGYIDTLDDVRQNNSGNPTLLRLINKKESR